jgi:hypothetical protein
MIRHLVNNANPLYQLSPQFIRRDDLTHHIRLMIVYNAYMAQILGTWGTITDLAKKHQVSRTFIYSLLSDFKEVIPLLFSDKNNFNFTHTKKYIFSMMLAFRLEGRCSIGATSTLMKRFNLSYSSVGSVSQTLSKIGELLPNTLKNKGNEVSLLVFAGDEIFCHAKPILITVDPVSSAILRIELSDQRTAEKWGNHFSAIQTNGFKAIALVSDEGNGLRAAQKQVLPDILWQADSYHAIAHRLGEWVNRLERSAYAAINTEEKYRHLIYSAKSNKTLEKYSKLYVQSLDNSGKTIHIYDEFSDLYHCLIHELKLFDQGGNLRSRDQVKENITIIFELMNELKHKKITKAISGIKKILDNILNYFDEAKKIVSHCQTFDIDVEALKSLCLAWQWNKAVIKSKNKKRKDDAVKQRQFYSEISEGFMGEDYKRLKEQVEGELDKIIQASSMVECINSILRPYLNNSKNQVNQHFLNLFMFYHNHRRYHAGKRKNKTPMEILTGEKQKEDWLDILIQTIEEKEPRFFSK